MSDYVFLYYAGYGYLLWCLFLAVMALKAKFRVLSIPVRIMSVPLLLVALFVDVTFNLIASLMFADLPREWMFTQRMNRYISEDDGWRATLAKLICNYLLDPFDSGHCK